MIFFKGVIVDVLVSFFNLLIWFIVVVILILCGLKKIGLGCCVGLMFIVLLGKCMVGIGYGLVICELVLVFFMFSNMVCGGGIVYFIMKLIVNVFDFDLVKGM